MIEFTDAARAQILAFLSQADEALALRVRVRRPSPVAPEYELLVVEPDDREAGDVVHDGGGFPVLVDAVSAPMLSGTRIGWSERGADAGFTFHSPGTGWTGGELTGTVEERVRRVIREALNPGLASHGGSVWLEEVRDGVAFLRMEGGCQGCGMAGLTLTHGIRHVLLQAIPELTAVEDVTDHAGGLAPYA